MNWYSLFDTKPNYGLNPKSNNERVHIFDKDRRVIHINRTQHFENSHPSRKFCNVADKSIPNLDSVCRPSLSQPEARHILGRVAEGLVSLWGKQICVVVHRFGDKASLRHSQ